MNGAVAMELYFWKPVTTAARVLVCLHEKGLAYAVRPVDLLDLGQFTESFLDINPFGQVPVLIDEGRPLTESVLINEYLEDAYPAVPLAPRDARGWYDQQCWTKFVDYHLTNSVATLGWWKETRPALGEERCRQLRAQAVSIPIAERRDAWLQALSPQPMDAQLDTSIRKITLALARMEKALADNHWLLGETYSLADIAAWPLVKEVPALLPELLEDQAYPGVRAWLERVGARPAVREAMAVTAIDDGLPAYAPGPEHSRWG